MGNPNLVAIITWERTAFHCLADELLGYTPVAVPIGCVYVVDSKAQSMLDDGDRLLFIERKPKLFPPAMAEPEDRNAQITIFHLHPPDGVFGLFILCRNWRTVRSGNSGSLCF